jgi:hypothetical protein
MKILKTVSRDYPIVAIALLLLACVKFEYQTADSAFYLPGLVGGLAVLAIVATVLLFRIFNAAQDACVARGLIPSRIRSKYDILIPVGIVVAAFQFRWVGEPFHGAASKSPYRWEFQWSDPGCNLAFIAALIGVVLLIRILYLLRAIASASNVKSE